MSDCLQPHGLQPLRLLRPWDFPGKSTGVDCHFLLHGIFPSQGLNPGLLHCRQTLYPLSHQGSPILSKIIHKYQKRVVWIFPKHLNMKVKVLVAQSSLTICNPMNCSLPGSSVHGTSQARILEWGAIPFSRGSSRPRDRTHVSWIGGRFFTFSATREASYKWGTLKFMVSSALTISLVF